jgi:hypothetical protein
MVVVVDVVVVGIRVVVVEVVVVVLVVVEVLSQAEMGKQSKPLTVPKQQSLQQSEWPVQSLNSARQFGVVVVGAAVVVVVVVVSTQVTAPTMQTPAQQMPGGSPSPARRTQVSPSSMGRQIPCAAQPMHRSKPHWESNAHSVGLGVVVVDVAVVVVVGATVVVVVDDVVVGHVVMPEESQSPLQQIPAR